jgi:hypothetical protein
MQPGYIALIFWVLAGLAIGSIIGGLRTGSITGPYTYTRDDNPMAFYLAILARVGIVLLAIAETLHALGLVGDPFTALNGIIPPRRY